MHYPHLSDPPEREESMAYSLEGYLMALLGVAQMCEREAHSIRTWLEVATDRATPTKEATPSGSSGHLPVLLEYLDATADELGQIRALIGLPAIEASGESSP